MKNDWSGQSLPHPERRRPVLGDVGGVDRDHPVQDIVRRGDRLGPLFEMRVFSQRFVFVGGARLAAEMCDESLFHKGHSPAVESLRAFAGDGLFTAYNHEPNWRLAHDILMPAFTREAMQRYHPTMLQTVRELFSMWDAHEGPVDIARGMTKLTMETLSRAAFDRDFGSLTEDAPHPFIPAMIAMLSTAQRLGSLAAMPGARVFRNRLLRQNQPHMRYIDELLDGVIDDRRALGSAGAGDDLLGLMLSATHPETGARLDDLNIRSALAGDVLPGDTPGRPRPRPGGDRPHPRTGPRRRADVRADSEAPVPPSRARRDPPAVADGAGLHPQPTTGDRVVHRTSHAASGLGDRGHPAHAPRPRDLG
jgi:cytochrome P450